MQSKNGSSHSCLENVTDAGTGEAKRSDVDEHSEIKPDFILESLEELTSILLQ
ncbi:MAG: hypothetical protein LBI05_03545 [Planctomycetaceae bacterium]|nr:hypothetical protein [Planctomycetaceae bacterium]